MQNNNLLILCFLLLLISGCDNSHNQAGKNEDTDLGQAVWITDKREWPVADSLMYSNVPAPLYRKEFTVKGEIKSAILYITAAGYYIASLNGISIGKNYLDPAWTDFSKRIYVTEYNITSDIKKGTNCIGVVLGNGFYNPLPIRMWGTFNLRDILPVGKPSFIASLKIEYTNGKIEFVNTNVSWKFIYGPILRNNVYIGEEYDAAKEVSGWNSPGFDDSHWKNSAKSKGPGGKLVKSFFPPVQKTGSIKPLGITSPVKGIYIADLGVNFTGLYRIRLIGKEGDTIRFRFGERLYDNGTLNPMTAVCGQIKKKGIGGPGSPDVAWQSDSYCFGDKSEVWYSPSFTYHVFRYMEISGLSYKPDCTDIEGIMLNTNVSGSGTFASSSGLINSVQQAIQRTFLNNLISVQSDCPGREKFGYGGDLNATSESFIYNFNMQTFYRKTLYDWIDVLNDSVFVDTAPYVGIKYCGISWESAFIITQYNLFLYYNDTALIRELYKSDLKWMEKAARLHPSGIVDKGLSDHESMLKVPVKLIGTTHYLECARIMKKFAGVMHDPENEQKFEKLGNDLRDKILDLFWRKPVPDTINRQTLFATLLYYGIVPENEKKAAVDSLIRALEKAPSGHFTTGIFGTKYILEALSETGNTGQVFDIVNSKAFPGWGFMIDRGATTIWETWKESDNVYSNCHPMFGSVTEWFYRYLGGIQPDSENPGFRKFTIAPSLPSGLDFVNCTYESPFGSINSNWRRSKNGVRHEISVPEGTSAFFEVQTGGKRSFSVENTDNGKVESKNASGSLFRAQLSEGNYIITY
jgi:alpha-L-rhamnosidase